MFFNLSFTIVFSNFYVEKVAKTLALGNKEVVIVVFCLAQIDYWLFNASSSFLISNICCSNSLSSDSLIIEPDLVKEESLSDLENVQRKVKLELVANLAQLGLTAEQIAQSLDLSLDDVKPLISEIK